MHPLRKKRLLSVLAILAAMAGAAGLAIYAFNQNMMFYFTPTDVVEGKAPTQSMLRLGGLVVKGSIHKDPHSTDVRFEVSDLKNRVVVNYSGVLPDLFREEQVIIAKGKVSTSGELMAIEVLAKHDENYMPPEVAESLKQNAIK